MRSIDKAEATIFRLKTLHTYFAELDALLNYGGLREKQECVNKIIEVV